MSVGAIVRRGLGPLERRAIVAYRNRFIDLGALADTLVAAAPDARRILEIGCGDGMMADALLRRLPDAHLLGIDPGMASPGRMYAGDRSRVEFVRWSSGQLLARHSPAFDLVLLVDVAHHVADVERAQVLADAATLTAPGGLLAFKEWERGPGFASRAAYVADRYVSGDTTVRFMDRAEIDALLGVAAGGWPVVVEARIPPRWANLLLVHRRPSSS